LQLAPGTDFWAAHWFTTGSTQAVRFDITMELFASSSLSQGTRLGVGNMDIGFVLGGTFAQAFVEFSGTGGLETQVFPQIISANPDGSLGWAQIGLQLDYTNALWSLDINGQSIADRQPLPFSPASAAEEYNYLMLSAGETAPAQVASVSLEEIPPLIDTNNQDVQSKSTTKDGDDAVRTSSQSSGGGRGGSANAPGNANGNPPDWTLGKEGDNDAGFVVYSPAGDDSGSGGGSTPPSVLLTPAMTSNSAPSPYVVFESGNAGWPAWQAFNQKTTHWESANVFDANGDGHAYIGIDLGTAKTLTNYTIRSRADQLAYQQFMRDFTVQGSNDGIMWTTLDIVTNYPQITSIGHVLQRTINNTAAFRYYKVDVTKNYINPRVVIDEIGFHGY
jgi:hypothetical protein